MTKNQCMTCIYNVSERAGFWTDGRCGGCECTQLHRDTRVSNYEDRFDTDCPSYRVKEDVMARCGCGGHPYITRVQAGLWKVKCSDCIVSIMSPSLETSLKFWNLNASGEKE